MKVLFLDVDGVLNNVDTLGENLQRRVEQIMAERGCEMNECLDEAMLDDDLVERVRRFVDEEDLTVVMSSTWRDHKGLFELFESKYGLTIHDKTPWKRSGFRGEEIASWLSNESDETIESFVILDDDTDMGHLRDRLVQTSIATGVTDEDIERARELLRV